MDHPLDRDQTAVVTPPVVRKSISDLAKYIAEGHVSDRVKRYAHKAIERANAKAIETLPDDRVGQDAVRVIYLEAALHVIADGWISPHAEALL